MGGGQDAALDNHVSGQSNKPISAPAHAMKWTAVADELQTDTDDGLTNEEAKRRLDEYGENVLGETGGVNPGKILLRQVANAMTLVLIMAMAVSFGKTLRSVL
jgi:P-type Na+/K+ transporter